VARVRQTLPSGHGEVVTRPDYVEWAGLAREGSRMAASWDATLCGVPVSELRRTARREAVAASSAFSARLGVPVRAVDGEPEALRRLAERTPAEHAGRLHIHHLAYAEVDALPDADLIHSSYALPYCAPEHFPTVWSAVRAALRPGAVLACQLFGPHDTSFGDAEMTFHSADQARALLDGLEIVHWDEEDADGTAYTGPKHWHVFHVVARRPAEA